ncbi:CitMHS family transporter [Cecembia calidifontis]|uniref:CitMHS family citrate-Mg2+:H+ or citrate-Ca2+:H+ symporter n=1 Tax=Cecembia calidifontis TaxID=1187080 RepID=A0A4Q7PBV1_9BACT|nr:citrate:proton symporter [Cecembia calidifontis]RZS97050.1 CitMHS family citrate-Mg2+:H+ or citrate-Ca2+:H+ symporter [Cecembia calidifontis]
MLAILGLMTIAVMLFLVITKKASPTVALILVPVVSAVLAGFGLEIFEFITQGILSIAPTGVMFIFAILFLGILTDSGTFQPIIKMILRLAGNDPAKVALGSAVLAMVSHLDGSGASTFLISVPAFLPVYDRLGMKRTTLACIVALAAGTMNILPWGGPTIRAASALEVPVTELFNPMLIPVVFGLFAVLIIAFFLGRKERIPEINDKILERFSEPNSERQKPRLFWVNILLILLAVYTLVSGFAAPHIIFMLAFAVAISINFPNVKEQAERINAHSKAVVLMVVILFAAGCFIGIMKGSGMIEAMARAAVVQVPEWIGHHLPLYVGLTAMPASLLFDPDSFYFGILPVLSNTFNQFGGEAIEIGRAAIVGQMTTGFPVSPLTGATFLLVGLTGVDMGSHQRMTIPYAFLVSLVILFFSFVVGAITL